MKKILSLALALILPLMILTSCKTEEKPDTVRVAAMKGATAMGMVKLMQDSEDEKTENTYDFSLLTADEITPKIATGEVDIAAVAANLASILYKNTDSNIRVLAVNTLGVLYIVEKGETIQSIEDLKGKTIYATGKGIVPEYTLNHLLLQNGINPETDLTIEYKSEPTEVLSILASGNGEIAMLPQPFVTSAVQKVEGLRIALDLTKEWDNVKTDESALITGVVIARKEFIEKYPESVDKFLEEYKKSTEYANSNNDETAELIGKYGIVDAEIAKTALPYCNITFMSGTEMKTKLSAYLNTLYAQNPQSVGGNLPDEEFYYVK